MCLVVGPGGDHKLILRVLHERAAEYLDESRLKDDLLAAIVRFKAHTLAQPNQQRPEVLWRYWLPAAAAARAPSR